MTHGDISDIISEILFRRQRCLTNYHYHSQSCDIPPMTTLGIDPLARVTSIRLHLRTRNDCRRAASIITRTPDITDLSIFFGDIWDIRLPSSFAPVCRDFIGILFGMEDTRCHFPRLRSLSLEQFTLRLSSPVLSQSMNFSKLEELRLLKWTWMKDQDAVVEFGAFKGARCCFSCAVVVVKIVVKMSTRHFH